MLQQLSVVALPLLLSVAVGSGTPALRAFDGRAAQHHSTTQEHHTGGTNALLHAPERQARATRYVVAPVGNEARYRVREQLARMDLPNDAIGKTNQVQGAIIVAADGRIVREGSSFTIDLKSIQSDNARRDGFLRRNTLQTDSFPTAVFVPTTARGLPSTLPVGNTSFDLMGDLTIHGVTRQATWRVNASRTAAGVITGTATTSFPFAAYGMTIPKVGMVLSVDDRITLEYDFNLLPQPATP